MEALEAANLSRPDWSTWFLRLAFTTAQRASCRRKRVGVLIVDDEHRIVAGGYNGAPRGMPDCLEVGCDVRVIDGRESCVRTIHAESNALDFAGRAASGCTMFTTVIPCRPCAMRIVQARISRVVYWEFYESQGTKETAKLLEDGNVRLHHFNVSRAVLDGFYSSGGPTLNVLHAWYCSTVTLGIESSCTCSDAWKALSHDDRVDHYARRGLNVR